MIYLQKCHREYPPETKEIFHLYDERILLIKPYLLPVFYRLCLEGYVVILSENFCKSDENKALLKLLFLHTSPEGIIDLGHINDDRKKDIDKLYTEYHSPYDDLQESLLRNIAVNTALLSSTINFESWIKSGHLLNYALQFTELVNVYAFQEKKKSFYAEKIGITQKNLTKSLQVIFHKTFRDILVYQNVIEAMRLLVFENKSITQIALELDYDVSGFNKLIFKYKHLSPKDLRIKYRNIIHQIENAC
ncbi:MAG: helix-turn-helix domain-containing protein [Proteiniphilum sp.]|nr:helix-turn-helix domain-containing protein [Proteiniphilum sp.]